MILIPCGLYWTRTSDPIDVNDVLYQLSQQTITGNERHYITPFVSGQGKFTSYFLPLTSYQTNIPFAPASFLMISSTFPSALYTDMYRSSRFRVISTFSSGSSTHRSFLSRIFPASHS